MDLDFLKLSWHYFQNNNNNIKIVHLNQHILNKYLYYPESISLTKLPHGVQTKRHFYLFYFQTIFVLNLA